MVTKASVAALLEMGITHQELSADEWLIEIKYHTELIQYLPNIKHHKLGIKLLNLGNFLNKAAHILMANFSKSKSLEKYLLIDAIYLTGTIRRNRKGFTNNLKLMIVGQVKYFSGNCIDKGFYWN